MAKDRDWYGVPEIAGQEFQVRTGIEDEITNHDDGKTESPQGDESP